jgi:tetratricopeptide (TPR) repeat protein
MEPENVEAELERYLQIAQQSGVTADIAFILMTLGEVARSVGDFATAHDYYSQSLEQYQVINNPFYMARLFQRIGFTCLALGQIKGGEEPLRQGLDLARAIGAKTFMADCLYNLGSVAGFSLRFDEYMAFYSEALAIRQEIGDRAGVALNLGGLAIGNFLQGNFAETTKLATEALEISSDLNHAESKSQ